jgi:hypothetical protein
VYEKTAARVKAKTDDLCAFLQGFALTRLGYTSRIMDKKIIAPDQWNDYLADFSTRNQGRRARFEAFSRRGVAEEDEEAVFQTVSISGDRVTVSRSVSGGSPITDEITGVHGIAVQLDSDGSDNTMEFMDTNGDLTVLHFESMVDGES